jgi:hypothetical protein
MQEYHTLDSLSSGDESIRPRHPSIIVLTPPVISVPLIWTAAADNPFCRSIDMLPSKAAQHAAAVIYDLLYDFRQQRIITNPCRLPIALIGGVTGYSKAAIWRTLPRIQRAGLLVWKNAGACVIVQLTPPDSTTFPRMRARVFPGSPPSTIPPSLRQLELDGWIALTLSANRQTITLLRDRDEVQR